MDQCTIRPVILSGGSGTRLWPMSTRALPKQFHALTGARSMIAETAARFGPQDGFAAPIVLGSAGHAELIEAQWPSGWGEPLCLLEPCARNTAPAAAAAALAASESDPEALLLLAPADHMIERPGIFIEAVKRAAPLAARDGLIVTFGIKPDRPETGYGYIKSGEPLEAGAHRVAAFKEKPLAPEAEAYLASGDYVWNAGIFLFRADVMLSEMEAHRPDILAAVRRSMERAARRGGRIYLDPASFHDCPSQSIDYAVMERTRRAAVAPVDPGWSDVGSWESLWSVRAKDESGNAASAGEGARAPMLHGCRNVLAVGEGPFIAAIDMEDVVIVATARGVLVAPLASSQKVKDIIEALKADGGEELL